MYYDSHVNNYDRYLKILYAENVYDQHIKPIYYWQDLKSIEDLKCIILTKLLENKNIDYFKPIFKSQRSYLKPISRNDNYDQLKMKSLKYQTDKYILPYP